MKHIIARWIGSLGIPLRVSIGFGFLASLLYFVAGFTGGDGRLGAWNVLYVISWPASWAVTQITARLEGRIPDRLFGFCYVSGVIAAGMVWFFLIALSIKYVATRLRAR
jgi:hypothetical protein